MCEALAQKVYLLKILNHRFNLIDVIDICLSLLLVIIDKVLLMETI